MENVSQLLETCLPGQVPQLRGEQVDFGNIRYQKSSYPAKANT